MPFLSRWLSKPMSLFNHRQIICHLSVDTFEMEHMETTPTLPAPYYPPTQTCTLLTPTHPAPTIPLPPGFISISTFVMVYICVCSANELRTYRPILSHIWDDIVMKEKVASKLACNFWLA